MKTPSTLTLFGQRLSAGLWLLCLWLSLGFGPAAFAQSASADALPVLAVNSGGGAVSRFGPDGFFGTTGSVANSAADRLTVQTSLQGATLRLTDNQRRCGAASEPNPI